MKNATVKTVAKVYYKSKKIGITEFSYNIDLSDKKEYSYIDTELFNQSNILSCAIGNLYFLNDTNESELRFLNDNENILIDKLNELYNKNFSIVAKQFEEVEKNIFNDEVLNYKNSFSFNYGVFKIVISEKIILNDEVKKTVANLKRLLNKTLKQDNNEKANIIFNVKDNFARTSIKELFEESDFKNKTEWVNNLVEIEKDNFAGFYIHDAQEFKAGGDWFINGYHLFKHTFDVYDAEGDDVATFNAYVAIPAEDLELTHEKYRVKNRNNYSFNLLIEK